MDKNDNPFKLPDPVPSIVKGMAAGAIVALLWGIAVAWVQWKYHVRYPDEVFVVPGAISIGTGALAGCIVFWLRSKQ